MDGFTNASAAIAWGSVSDWVSGVATVLAVVIALIFSLRAESETTDQRLAAVYAWFVVNHGTGELWLHNATEIPIYRWSVIVSWPTGPSQTKSVNAASDTFGILPPGRFSFSLQGADSLPSNDSVVQVDLRFTDARQRNRRRTPTGRLLSERRRGT